MKGFIVAMVFSGLASGLFAQTGMGTIREVSGVVEIKAPGSGNWVPAHRGDILERNTIISTGFKSTAILSLGESVLIIQPLSRLSLEELARRPEKDEVSIRMRVGRVRAAVTPPENGKVEFTIRSPMATASVRGTVFDFDTINLNVREGWVNFSTPVSPALPVKAGAGSSVDEINQAVTPSATITDRALFPAAPMGTASSGILTGGAAPGPGFNPGPDSGSDAGSDPSGSEGFTVDVNW
ncbi:MAG: FecR family protein [Treponema sp.]|nr:FecR family protein [Treponema sp.]